MTNSYTIFKFSFIFWVLAYIIFGGASIINTVITVYFFITVVFLVFKLEAIPKDSTNLKYLDIHKYYKSSMNEYGYIRAISLAILCILYFSLTTNFHICKYLN